MVESTGIISQPLNVRLGLPAADTMATAAAGATVKLSIITSPVKSAVIVPSNVTDPLWDPAVAATRLTSATKVIFSTYVPGRT